MTATIEVLCILGMQEDMKLVREDVGEGQIFESDKDHLLTHLRSEKKRANAKRLALAQDVLQPQTTT